MTSPVLKSSARFLSTPIVVSIFVLVDDMHIVWLDWIGNLISFQMCLGITMISEPESKMLSTKHPDGPNFTSITQSRRLWCTTMVPSSLRRTQLLKSCLTFEGLRPASSLMWTVTVIAGIIVITCLTVVRLQKCLQISSNTAKRSLMGTGMLVLSMQLSMHWGAVLSSSRNEYLYCWWKQICPLQSPIPMNQQWVELVLIFVVVVVVLMLMMMWVPLP